MNVGTVASVKGQTHDATLLVHTSLGKMKLAKKVAEALVTRNVITRVPEEIKLLTNAFVAATRPRYLLALAAPVVTHASGRAIDFQQNGWQVH